MPEIVKMHDTQAPTEEILPGVFIPLLILPKETTDKKNKHHALFDSEDPLLQGADNRPARWSRVQYVSEKLHGRYHAFHPDILLPVTDEQHFQTTFALTAGYVPACAEDVSGKRPRIVRLSQEERHRIQSTGVINVQPRTRWAIGFYFGRYILRNGLEAIREAEEVARFVDASEDEKKFRSFDVVRAAANVVLEAMEPTYERARNEGRIRRAEPTAVRFMMRHFEEHQPDYVPEITARLQLA